MKNIKKINLFNKTKSRLFKSLIFSFFLFFVFINISYAISIDNTGAEILCTEKVKLTGNVSKSVNENIASETFLWTYSTSSYTLKCGMNIDGKEEIWRKSSTSGNPANPFVNIFVKPSKNYKYILCVKDGKTSNFIESSKSSFATWLETNTDNDHDEYYLQLGISCDNFNDDKVDPDDDDPCNPDTTTSACDDYKDKDLDGDGFYPNHDSSTNDYDPDDDDPCNPDTTASTCTNGSGGTGTGTGSSSSGGNEFNPLKVNSMEQLIGDILSGLTYILTPIIVLAFIYTGFLFVAAQGEPEKIKTAKTAFTYTVIGAALVLGANLIFTVITTTLSNLLT